jgi:hypothetical protein
VFIVRRYLLGLICSLPLLLLAVGGCGDKDTKAKDSNDPQFKPAGKGDGTGTGPGTKPTPGDSKRQVAPPE